MMAKRHETLNVRVFLESAGPARKVVEHRRGGVIFDQGDPCDTVLYVQKGGVKVSVLSTAGREGVVAMLGPGDFFGEGCLSGQPVRTGSATAMVPSTILLIDKDQMVTLLHEQPALSDRFIAHMLTRNIRIQEDLVDQLFNSTEQRLARTLLLLARHGQRGAATGTIPKITQETLAEMVGTTRARVNVFMNKFKRLGFIDYTHELNVHATLQAVVAGDDLDDHIAARRNLDLAERPDNGRVCHQPADHPHIRTAASALPADAPMRTS
jgi:CRP/FNR family transcriptional regulator, cyclic AMP receptor protein